MKGTFYVGIVLLLVVFAAQPVVGQAQHNTVQFEIPETGLPFVTCLGETISCDGSLLITARQLIDGSGALHFTTQVRDLGVICTGDDSGTTYRLSSTETEATRIDLPCEEEGCVSVVTFHRNFVSPGPAENLISVIRVLQLITPNGNLDIFDANLNIRCAG